MTCRGRRRSSSLVSTLKAARLSVRGTAAIRLSRCTSFLKEDGSVSVRRSTHLKTSSSCTCTLTLNPCVIGKKTSRFLLLLPCCTSFLKDVGPVLLRRFTDLERPSSCACMLTLSQRELCWPNWSSSCEHLGMLRTPDNCAIAAHVHSRFCYEDSAVWLLIKLLACVSRRDRCYSTQGCKMMHCLATGWYIDVMVSMTCLLTFSFVRTASSCRRSLFCGA